METCILILAVRLGLGLGHSHGHGHGIAFRSFVRSSVSCSDLGAGSR